MSTQSQPPTDPAQEIARAFSNFRSFAGLLAIVPKSGPRCRLQLNDIQRAYCKARTPRDVVLKPRQIGFTTLEQARDVHHFLTVPGARVVATCQSLVDRAPLRLLSKNYEVMFDSLRRLGVRLDFRTETASEWTLADKDASLRIVESGASEAAASKKGRAGTITRLHLTETAYYEYADETLLAMLECVPGIEHGTEIVSESTPHGASGVFYRQCKDAQAGTSGYRLHFFPWFEAREYAAALDPGEQVAPRTDRERWLVERHRITPEQLKWYQRKLAEKGSQELIDQEYPSDPETCFLVSGRTFFDSARVAAMLTETRSPSVAQQIRGSGAAQQRVAGSEIPALRVWYHPEPDREYVVSCDTSEGTGGDAGAAVVLERGTGRHMATLWGQFRPWVLAKHAAALGRKFNKATIAVERNNHGGTVLRALEADEHYPHIFADRDEKPGWNTSEASRGPSLDTLEQAVRAAAFTTNDQHLLAEMRTFIVNDRGRAEAARGSHDDLVMATAIGWDVICRTQRPPRRDLAGFIG